jgi:hypothetical protein
MYFSPRSFTNVSTAYAIQGVGQAIYPGAVTPYSSGIPPKLVIPDQVPAGLYVASLEIVGKNGEVLVTSKPYARKLLVK